MKRNQRRWIIEECGEDVEQASLHLTGELVPIRVVAPIAAQPPATAQGLREDAQHITVYCDHRGSTAGTPCKSCSLIAGRLRELADWLAQHAERPLTTRAQVLAAVNRYIVAIWSHETTEHEKAIDELMRDLGIEEVE